MPISMSLEISKQTSINEIYKIHKPEETRGPVILKVTHDEDNNTCLEAVYHREISWTWWERVCAFFGCSSYNLSRVILAIENLTLFDGLPSPMQNDLIGIMNKKIFHYNDIHWFSLPFFSGDLQVL